jgi:hypothetical protein
MAQGRASRLKKEEEEQQTTRKQARRENKCMCNWHQKERTKKADLC